MKSLKVIENIWSSLYLCGFGSDPQAGLRATSYLLILKKLAAHARDEGTWHELKELARQQNQPGIQQTFASIIRHLRALHPDSCLAEADSALVRLSLAPASALARLVSAIESLCEDASSLLEAQEALITSAGAEGAYSSLVGQIFTPMHLAQLMVDLLRPQPDEVIIDPACGSGNLLVAAATWLQAQAGLPCPSCFLADGRIQVPAPGLLSASACLQGVELAAPLLAPAYAHLFLAGVESPQLFASDALGGHFAARLANDEFGSAAIVLANPPFSGHLDWEDLPPSLRWLRTKSTELLFVDLCLQLLRDGGRAALLLPEGVLFGASTAAVALRKKLVEENQVQAIISLPAGVFQPATGVKTSILILTKGGTTEQVWGYRCRQDGYTLNARRIATPGATDLWDVRMQFAAFFGLTPPAFVPALYPTEMWEDYASDFAQAAVLSARPTIATNHEHEVTDLVLLHDPDQRTCLLSRAEIEARQYNLCLSSHQDTSFHLGDRR